MPLPAAIDSPIVMVSDIHIKDENDSRYFLLIEVIKKINTSKVHHFVLLGDIFDFCFGGAPYFRKKYSALGAVLQKLSQNGVKIYFIEGNHEFAMKHMGWQWVTFITEKTLAVATKQAQLAFTHGDQLIFDPAYLLLRHVLKHPWAHLILRLLPGKLLHFLSLKLAELSRHKRRPKVNHKKLLYAAGQWLESTGCQHGVFGHYHIPYLERKKGSNESFIVSFNSWIDKPNILLFDDSKFSRLYL